MKSKLLITIIAVLHWGFLLAQNQTPEQALQEINKIKLSGNYIWAEGTSTKSQQEALENAQSVLKFEVQNLLKATNQNSVEGFIMSISDQCMKIQTQKRSLYRAFVYVNKNTMIPYNNEEKVMVVNRAAEKEKAKKKKGTVEEPISSVESIYSPTVFEKELLSICKRTEIEGFIAKHHIGQHGKFKEKPNSGSYYMIIYNKDGDIPACLKFTDGVIINVATGEKDSFSNYKGCGGHWLIHN